MNDEWNYVDVEDEPPDPPEPGDAPDPAGPATPPTDPMRRKVALGFGGVLTAVSAFTAFGAFMTIVGGRRRSVRGSTHSYYLEWQQRQAEIDAATGDEKPCDEPG